MPKRRLKIIMSPAPRHFKNGTSVHPVVVPRVPGNNNTTKRVPLTDAVRQFLEERPCILIPELNVNKSKEVNKPLVNGTKVRLPISKMAIVHGLLPPHLRKKRQPNKDIREDETKKESFLSALNLVDKKVAEKNIESHKNLPLDSSLEKRLRSRKGQVVTFFKNNPLPITSRLGQQIIDAGIGKCPNSKDEITRNEKYCSSKMRCTKSTKWPEVNSRKSKLKKDQYCHTYSFGPSARIKRNVELTIGLSEQSFPLLNQCRDASVQVYRMSDNEVAKEMMTLQSNSLSSHQSKQSGKKSSSTLASGTDTNSIPWGEKVPVRWISSEPIAGPSRAIERIAQPIVQLYDIRLSPGKFSKYFK